MAAVQKATILLFLLALGNAAAAECQTSATAGFGSVDPRAQRFASMASSSEPLEPAFVALLRELLADPRESIRVDALHGLAAKAGSLLLRAPEGPDRRVIEDAWPLVRAALDAPEEHVRRAAVRTIRVMGAEPVRQKPGLFTIGRTVAELLANRYFEDPAPLVRGTIVEAFRMSDEQSAAFRPLVDRVLRAASGDADADVVASALYAMSARKDEADLAVAAELLGHSSPRVRGQAVHLLASSRELARPFLSQLRIATNDEPDTTVKKAMETLLLLLERQ